MVHELISNSRHLILTGKRVLFFLLSFLLSIFPTLFPAFSIHCFNTIDKRTLINAQSQVVAIICSVLSVFFSIHYFLDVQLSNFSSNF